MTTKTLEPVARKQAAAQPWWAKFIRAEARAGYLFILPWLIGVVLFVAAPMLASLYLSFTHYDILTDPTWAGTSNYQQALHDPLFWQSLKISGIYTVVVVPTGMVLAFLVALMLNQRVRGLGFFRSIYYLPVLIPAVVSAVLFGWLFNPEFGLINTGLALIGLEGPLWLASTRWALPTLMILNLWGVGASMLIYLGGLQSIPTELYEAAHLDGANVLRRLWHVTVPMMTPVIFFTLVLGIINSFQVFTSSFVLTQGGPNNATLFYLLYLYNNAFQFFRMGYASALAWILFMLLLVLILLVLRSATTWVHYEGKVDNR